MALWKLTWTEIKLLVREPVTMIFTFAFPLLVLLVLGGIFRSDTVTGGNYRNVLAMDYYVPGYIGLVIASIGMISLPVHLATYRERGVLRRLRASGLKELTYFGSQTVVAFLIAVVGGLLVYLLGAVVYDAGRPDSLGRVLLTARRRRRHLRRHRHPSRRPAAERARRAGCRAAPLVHDDVPLGHRKPTRPPAHLASARRAGAASLPPRAGAAGPLEQRAPWTGSSSW